MMGALSLGIILSTGLGVEQIEPPDVPGISVRSARWHHVRPSDASLLVDWAEEMHADNISPIALVGSSRGVGVAQVAIADAPEQFDGGVVLVSGAGGPNWSPHWFSKEVLTPVFLMCGLDESDHVLYRMEILDSLLTNAGKDHSFKHYDGKHGFLAKNEEAQSDLRQFLKWTLSDGERPEWFKCQK